jgi:putative peptidoglycan lipid II flippase
VARGVLGLLALVTAVVVLLGVWAAPVLVGLLAPGFEGPKRELTVTLVRILFPGTGILVLSAWCLGILNSHGRFLLSYSAPVAWNLVIIVATVAAAAGRTPADLTVAIAWAAVAGSLLQVAVQLPGVRRALAGQPAATEQPGRSATEGIGLVVRNFLPALASRGVAQLSAWFDLLIATLLGTGAAAGLAMAQMISTLPVSLFGMSVSASELPAMAARTGADSPEAALRDRLEAGWARIAFYVVPSAAAFLALGHVIAATVFQSGAFTAAESTYLWVLLAGAAVGLLASTLARLTASAFHALGDTRTPFRWALARMGVGIVLGLVAALVIVPAFGLEPRLGVAGLMLGGGLAGWMEFALLKRSLERRLGPLQVGGRHLAALWGMSAIAALIAWLPLAAGIMRWQPLAGGLAVLALFGSTYLAIAWILGVSEARHLAATLRPRHD